MLNNYPFSIGWVQISLKILLQHCIPNLFSMVGWTTAPEAHYVQTGLCPLPSQSSLQREWSPWHRSKKQIRGLLAIKYTVILRAVHLLLFKATVSEPSFSEALQIFRKWVEHPSIPLTMPILDLTQFGLPETLPDVPRVINTLVPSLA